MRKRLLCGVLAILSACSVFGCGAATAAQISESRAIGYESRLFDSSFVHAIEVSIDDADWEDLKENPLDKTKYLADVTIDGETIKGVSFSTKGNTSLSFVASDPESDRYSFKLNFGKFVENQTYHGLDKLNLNNLYADATYLKDYLCYRLFEQSGVAAPLTSYVWLTVNGAPHGLYLAIEEIGESYLNRTRGGAGVLYKPETEQLDNAKSASNAGNPTDRDAQSGFTPSEGMIPPDGTPGDFTPSEGMTPPDRDAQSGFTPPEGMTPPDGTPGEFTSPEGMIPPGRDAQSGFTPPDGMQGGPGRPDAGSNGADLVYSEDDLSSYSDIFDNAKTAVTDADKQRVIAALKALSEQSGLSDVLDTDEIIRYFAAHNFVLNYDSYTGNMLHNYYLYENDGKLAMLPWDYNLAFGAFGGASDVTGLLNTGIDTPLSGASEDARPMWAWIVKDDAYRSSYHAVFDELLTAYFDSGVFSREVDALYELLLPYVEADPTAFYTVEQYKTAVTSLKRFCLLRAESVRRQLDGSLSTDTEAQDAAQRIDASDLDLSAMGSHGGAQRPQP